MHYQYKGFVLTSFLLAGFIAGCGGGGSSSDDPTSVDDQRVMRDVDFGSALEEATAMMGMTDSKESLKLGDVEFLLSANAIDIPIEFRLMRSELELAPAEDVGTDIVYLTMDERPVLSGDSSLVLPLSMAPSGIDPIDIQVYAWYKGQFLVPVDALIDINGGTATIDRPDATVMYPPYDNLRALSAGFSVLAIVPDDPEREPEIGYVLGRENLDPMCLSGAPGEIHMEPGHAFVIHVQKQTTCEFVMAVSSYLQEALDDYNVRFHSNGTAPLGHLKTDNRMAVYVGDYKGVNGEYKFMSWNGYVQVDTAGSSNLVGLRGTLFHEMFHAIQDAYSNMYLAGNLAMWWYEATAEWAGLSIAREFNLAQAAQYELPTYSMFLSVPIEESRSYAGGYASYAYSTMIYAAEDNTPGYVADALRGDAAVSGLLYKNMVEAAALTENYGDWLHDMLSATINTTAPWTSARIFESDTMTRVFDVGNGKPGDQQQVTEQQSVDSKRYVNRTFRTDLKAMTARFYLVQSLGSNVFNEPRSVKVSVKNGNEDWPHVWLIMRKGAAPYNISISPMTRESRVGEIGGDTAELFVVVYNPAEKFSETIDVNLHLMSASQEYIWRSPVACDEPDEAYSQKWLVSLNQEGTSVGGRISFHACPGGGQVSYSLSGTAEMGSSRFVLDGTRSAGRGELLSSSPASQQFTLSIGSTPAPNFAP